MPIDTSIYGNVSSFAEQYAHAQQVQAQLSAAQQQQQMGKFQVLQAKQDWEDQQNLRVAYRQANGDPVQTLANAAKLGVSPKMLQALQAQNIQIQTNLANLDKIKTDTGKSKLDQLIATNDMKSGIVQPLIDAKSDAEFQAQKPAMLQRLQGIATDDELKQLAGASQQDVKNWQLNHMSLKAHAEQVQANAAQTTAAAKASDAQVIREKQDNEAAGQIADVTMKQRQRANGILTAAYNNGGVTAYKKALTDPRVLPVAGFFDNGDNVAAAPSIAAAHKLIGNGAMSAAEMASQQHNEDVLAEQTRYHTEELKLRQQSTNIQRQMLGLDYTKTQAAMYSAGLGPDGKPLADNDKMLITPNIQNTSDGRVYIDQDTAMKGLPKGQQLQLKQLAAAQGIPLLGSKDAAAIHDMDVARNKINSVFQTFMQHSGAGKSGTLLATAQGIGNWIGAKTQILPDLKAARADFLSSIEGLKSAGGQGSGLRITGAEIAKIGSLLPEFNDTQETLGANGNGKIQRFNQVIDDKLNAFLHQVPVNHSAPSSSVPSASSAPSTPGRNRGSF